MLEVVYHKRFLKDLSDIPSSQRKEMEQFVFEVLPTLKSIAESERFEKMSGYENCYKARFGNYRIGVYYSKNCIELKRVLHRKEIYRYFP